MPEVTDAYGDYELATEDVTDPCFLCVVVMQGNVGFNCLLVKPMKYTLPVPSLETYL